MTSAAGVKNKLAFRSHPTGPFPPSEPAAPGQQYSCTSLGSAPRSVGAPRGARAASTYWSTSTSSEWSLVAPWAVPTARLAKPWQSRFTYKGFRAVLPGYK